MISNISSQNFKARIVFTTPNTKVKPYATQHTSQAAVLHTKKGKEPSWLLKLLFGLKKKIKFPSLKGE